MNYTAEDILEENYGDDVAVVQDGRITGLWRWGTTHQTVVQIGAELYAVTYRVQPEEGVQDHGELYRVLKREIIEYNYVSAE